MKVCVYLCSGTENLAYNQLPPASSRVPPTKSHIATVYNERIHRPHQAGDQSVRPAISRPPSPHPSQKPVRLVKAFKFNLIKMMLNWWGALRPLCALVLWSDNRTPRAFSLSFAPHRKTRYKKFIVRFLLDAGGQLDGDGDGDGDQQFKHERKNQASANMTQSAIYCGPTQAPECVSAAVRTGVGVFVCLNVSTSPRRRNRRPSFRMSDKVLSMSHFLSTIDGITHWFSASPFGWPQKWQKIL